MNKFVLRQSFLLLLTATIWGFSFVAQSVGIEYVGGFTFTAARSVLGFAVLLPVIAVRSKYKKKTEKTDNRLELQSEDKDRTKDSIMKVNQDRKILIIGGVLCGIILCISSNLQQFGIKYTTVGKAGFITALYIVLVPVLGIFIGKRAGWRIWIGVVIAVFGLYLLCMQGNAFVLKKGDILIMLCALAYAFHILVIDYFAPRTDCVKLSCIQFLVCSVLSGICMMIFENPSMDAVIDAGVPILYAGIMSSGVAFTLQIVGQEGMNPTVASLIMSLESVVSVLAGWLLLHQKLSTRELIGCILMFTAIILVQIPEKKQFTEKSQ